MKKIFKGKVKPYFYLDVVHRDVQFGETITLEEQHLTHPSILDAKKYGWLTEVNKNQMSQMTMAKAAEQTKQMYKKFAMTQPLVEAKIPEEPVKPAASPQYVELILEKQAEMIKGIQKSYESIQKEVAKKHEVNATVHALPNPEVQLALREIMATQKGLLELVNKKLSEPQAQSASVLTEIKDLLAQGQTRQEDPGQVVQTLKEIQETLKNQKTQIVYNNEKQTEKDGFKIQDFEGKYIAQVEDLDVKDSKIVTETHKGAGTDDALAALKKLKQK